MVEKVIGNNVAFNAPTPMNEHDNLPKGIVAGIYAYQPAETLVPAVNANAWLNGDMKALKDNIESQANITVLLCHLSCNITQAEENYYRVSDYEIGMVFLTKDENQVPSAIITKLLHTYWYSDFWYACGMQNAPIQAYNLNVRMWPNWIFIVAGIGGATLLGLAIYVYAREKHEKTHPPLPPPPPIPNY